VSLMILSGRNVPAFRITASHTNLLTVPVSEATGASTAPWGPCWRSPGPPGD
jgi:hypothetical protein